MTDTVSWVVEMAIQPGKLDEFKALMNEMVAATQANEPGTLAYEWFFDADGTRCHLYERYTDSAAAMTHLGTFGEKFAERFLSAAKPERFVVYGNADAQVHGVLDGMGAAYMAQLGGFAR